MWIGKHVKDLAPEPQEFDPWNGFPTPQLYTNGYEGSCVECEEENAACGNSYAAGKPCTFSDATVHSNYRTQTGGGDDGLDLGSCLDWHQANGSPDEANPAVLHYPGPHGSLPINDLALLSKANYYFGTLKIAISTPSVFMNAPPGDCIDFPVNGNPGPVDHGVCLVGRKLINGIRYWRIETWGFYVYVTDNFLTACLGEAWARYDDADRFQPNGQTIEGFNEAALLADWAAFTAGPMPPAPPAPPPTPTPAPFCNRTVKDMVRHLLAAGKLMAEAMRLAA